VSFLKVLVTAIAISLFAESLAAQCIEFNTAPQQGGFIWGTVEPGSEVRLDDSV
jgi:hypothetical protein